MKKFEKFEIKKTVIITGGKDDRHRDFGPYQLTTWYGLGGASANDMFSKKNLFLNMKIIIAILFHINLFSQTVYNDVSFKKQIFSLKIIQNKSVSDKDFNKGKFVFGAAIEDGLESYADYLNLAVALSYLKEDDKLVKYSVKKALYLDSERILSLYRFLKRIDSIEYNKRLKWFPSIKSKLLKLEKEKSLFKTETKDTFNINSYCKKNKLDRNLVKLMRSISKNDQKYRGQDYKKNLIKQRRLDSLNLKIIDFVYKKHGTYIGKSLVGDQFSFVMWLVIQHSNIEKMEEYLPILIEAVKKKELKLNPLKMLIDRIHTVKCGNQIFGTQMGVDLAKEKVRKKVIAKYEIDSLE